MVRVEAARGSLARACRTSHVTLTRELPAFWQPQKETNGRTQCTPRHGPSWTSDVDSERTRDAHRGEHANRSRERERDRYVMVVRTGNGDEKEEYPRIHEPAGREEAAAAAAAAAASWEGSPVHHAPKRIAASTLGRITLLRSVLLRRKRGKDAPTDSRPNTRDH